MDACALTNSLSGRSSDDTFGRSSIPSRTLRHLVGLTDDHAGNHPLRSFDEVESCVKISDKFNRPSTNSWTLEHPPSLRDHRRLERASRVKLADTFGRPSATFRTLGHLSTPADDHHIDDHLPRGWKLSDTIDRSLTTHRTPEHRHGHKNIIIDYSGDENPPSNFDLLSNGKLLGKSLDYIRNDHLPSYSWLDVTAPRDQLMIIAAMGSDRRLSSPTMFGRTVTTTDIPGEDTSASFFAPFGRGPAAADCEARPRTASYLSRNVRVRGSTMVMTPRPASLKKKTKNDTGSSNSKSSERRRRSRTAPMVITRNLERPRHQSVPPLSSSCSPKGKLSITVNMDHLISSSIDETEQATTQSSKVPNEDEDSMSLTGNADSSESPPNLDHKLPVLKGENRSSHVGQKCVCSIHGSPSEDSDVKSSKFGRARDRDFAADNTKPVDPFERLLNGLREPRFRRLVVRDGDGERDVGHASGVDGNIDDVIGFEKDLDIAIAKLEQLRSNFAQAAGMK